MFCVIDRVRVRVWFYIYYVVDTHFDDARPKQVTDQKVHPTSSNLRDGACFVVLCRVDAVVKFLPKPVSARV